MVYWAYLRLTAVLTDEQGRNRTFATDLAPVLLGRASLMRDVAYPYLEIEESGYVYPIIEIGVSYYSSLRYDDPFWIYTRPADRERVRLRFDYVIAHASSGALICKGFTRHCATNSVGVPVAVDAKTVHLWNNFPI